MSKVFQKRPTAGLQRRALIEVVRFFKETGLAGHHYITLCKFSVCAQRMLGALCVLYSVDVSTSSFLYFDLLVYLLIVF